MRKHLRKFEVCVPPPADLINENIKYVCHLYGHENQADVNLVRYQVFRSGKFEEELLPPNADSLSMHIKRGAYQCHIWRNATLPD